MFFTFVLDWAKTGWEDSKIGDDLSGCFPFGSLGDEGLISIGTGCLANEFAEI